MEIVVKLSDGTELVLTPNPDWSYCKLTARGEGVDSYVPDGPLAQALLIARPIVDGYRYNPGHGYPGYMLASRVADAVGGEAILPPIPPAPPDAIP
jgi:hypothetical protein